MGEITVVKVEPEVAWECEAWGDCIRPTVAYIALEYDEETKGYCAHHIGPAVLAALRP